MHVSRQESDKRPWRVNVKLGKGQKFVMDQKLRPDNNGAQKHNIFTHRLDLRNGVFLRCRIACLQKVGPLTSHQRNVNAINHLVTYNVNVQRVVVT